MQKPPGYWVPRKGYCKKLSLGRGACNSLTILYRVLEILQSFSLEKVNFFVNYAILSIISFVKRFHKLLRKFTA